MFEMETSVSLLNAQRDWKRPAAKTEWWMLETNDLTKSQSYIDILVSVTFHCLHRGLIDAGCYMGFCVLLVSDSKTMLSGVY